MSETRTAGAARTPSDLARRISESFPEQDDRGRVVALGLYRELARTGRPVAPASLAARLRIPPAEVSGRLDEWPAVFRDEEGRVVGFWGLALSPTAHRLKVEGRELYAWCAWDCLFLPRILGRPARVESTCPVTGRPIRLEVAPESIHAADPSSAVVSFLDPDEADFTGERVISTFCHHIHFFASEEVGAKWTREHPGTFVLSLGDAFWLGAEVLQHYYGAALRRVEGPDRRGGAAVVPEGAEARSGRRTGCCGAASS